VDRAEATARLELFSDRITKEGAFGAPEIQEQAIGRVARFRHKDCPWRSPLLSPSLRNAERETGCKGSE
jgi:hypothetical protein